MKSEARGMKEKLNWRRRVGRNGLLMTGNTIVGTVTEDSSGRGWWAYGCREKWEDVKLGLLDTEAQAKRVVREWAEENA